MNEKLTKDTQKDIIELLDLLNEDERKEVFENYCIYCGTKYLPCWCMGDD